MLNHLSDSFLLLLTEGSYKLVHFAISFNPLTTDDECTHLGARYQLAHSVFKIGFVLAKKMG